MDILILKLGRNVILMLIQTFSQQTPPVSIATLRPKITALTSCFQTSYVLCYVHDLFHLSHHITHIQNMKRQHFYDVVLVLDLMRVWYFIYYIRDPFIQFNPIVLFTWREFCQSKTMASQITKKSHMSISLVWWALSPSLSHYILVQVYTLGMWKSITKSDPKLPILNYLWNKTVSEVKLLENRSRKCFSSSPQPCLCRISAKSRAAYRKLHGGLPDLWPMTLESALNAISSSTPHN